MAAFSALLVRAGRFLPKALVYVLLAGALTTILPIVKCRTIVVLYCFYIAFLHMKLLASDPGRVPLNDQQQTALVCKKCGICRPQRAHHCRRCRSCIYVMDHHCIWIDKCVGHGNFKLFFHFLFFSVLGCLLGISIILSALVVCPVPERSREGFATSMGIILPWEQLDNLGRGHFFQWVKGYDVFVCNEVPRNILSMIYMSLVLSNAALLLGYLLRAQTAQALRNHTFIETISIEDLQAKYPGVPFIHPFDIGYWENIKFIMGKPWEWLIPSLPSQSEVQDAQYVVSPEYLKQYKEKVGVNAVPSNNGKID